MLKYQQHQNKDDILVFTFHANVQ